ncbi:hypothetical protein [Lewinella sp. JB7]|uniref:hypothetical protein n=1 Tax=Lewinella sp. JB7 TaxID=2962887 RepID=UPI0020CA2148|nr:hypothetical protein [Lewinella sp. JB7]MCP9235282.1 hypothetical protein [Lewinella sp. JB7]
MPLLILLLGFFFPRLIIVLLYFFAGWFRGAFDGILLPLLGFIFLPLTTLWYGISEVYFDGNVQLVGLVVAVLLDLGIVGSRLRR